MATETKYVYFFGAGKTEGNANMRELLGGKGANLAEMAGLGLPVPQGFTISTEACTRYYDDGKVIGDDIMAQVMEYIDKLEKSAGKKFGDAKNPLLVSVRSGARASMPGMDARAPERTETRRGFFLSPNFLPADFSSLSMYSITCFWMSGAIFLPSS